jgi:hypothetical protein
MLTGKYSNSIFKWGNIQTVMFRWMCMVHICHTEKYSIYHDVIILYGIGLNLNSADLVIENAFKFLCRPHLL